MQRPRRLYHHTFVHEDPAHTVMLPAIGETPCRAKNQAFEYLERLIKVDGLPPTGWRLLRQEDQGVVIG